MEGQKDKFPELLKLEKQCRLFEPRGRVDRRLSGRRQLHAALLRAELVPEQQRVREDSRVRRAVPEVGEDARRGRSATSCTRR